MNLPLKKLGIMNWGKYSDQISIEESMPSSVRQALSAAELPKLGLHNAKNDE